ncbi:MAG: hypothetical protein SGJ27_29725 [Candidatus Melainabacteria bacterium]|nr:hypothetical protein [Candidatus Melainabacteria bacterium]
MKRTLLSLAALVALGLPGQAHAQNYLDLPSWQHWNLNTMSTDEQARIREGVRNGSLNSQEAARLQARLNSINTYKSRLSSGGLSRSERLRIDRELDNLAQAIYKESTDNQRRGGWLGKRPFDWTRGWKANVPTNQNWNAWQHWNFNTMSTDEERRISQGVRNGSLTASEAATLRARLNQINTMKAQLANNGLSMSERRRIDAELDALGQSIYRESHDHNTANRWRGAKPMPWTKTWKHTPYAANTNRRDGVPGRGVTAQEQLELDRQANRIENKRDRMEATGGGLNRREQRTLSEAENRLDNQQRRDRRD